jgi:hypothetical protein
MLAMVRFFTPHARHLGARDGANNYVRKNGLASLCGPLLTDPPPPVTARVHRGARAEQVMAMQVKVYSDYL